MLKDLKLAMEAAQSVNADVPMGARAAELYAQFDADGKGSLDFSAIIKILS
jgi:3-hydroxyisobutyrate dehydrogenase